VSGVKPCIEEGLKTQNNLYKGAIEEARYTQPASASLTNIMLDISVKFCDGILILIYKTTTEHVMCHSEAKPDKPLLQICAIVQQVFQEPRKVRHKGAGAFNQHHLTHWTVMVVYPPEKIIKWWSSWLPSFTGTLRLYLFSLATWIGFTSPSLLIPQVRPAHKYPNSPWETIHPPGGDNAECVCPHKVYTAECNKSLTTTYQCKTPIPSNRLLVNNILTNN
jgi:hypothetical protein